MSGCNLLDKQHLFQIGGIIVGRYYDLDAAEELIKILGIKKLPADIWVPPAGVSEEERWNSIKKHFYATNRIVFADGGNIDFSPWEVSQIVNAPNLTYDEYLELAWNSRVTARGEFELAYYGDMGGSFTGKVDRVSSHGKVCFSEILVEGFYEDGIGYSGVEEHVWMDSKEFPDLKPGICVNFGAEVYRYLKRGHGKALDYGLRNPYSIEVVEKYELPSKLDLLMQDIDHMTCQMCMYREHCYLGNCIAEDYRKAMRECAIGLLETTDFKPLIL